MGSLSYFRSGVGKADTLRFRMNPQVQAEASGSGFGEVSGAVATGTRSQTGRAGQVATEANYHPASQEQLSCCITCL